MPAGVWKRGAAMKGKKKPKASRGQALFRVTEILRNPLDGAQERDVSECGRERRARRAPPGKRQKGKDPLPPRKTRRYIEKADRTIANAEMSACTAELMVHLARRENLYAKAVNAGDVKAALAVLIDEARL